MPLSGFFYVANMSSKAIRENKILAKISKFTVCDGRLRVCRGSSESSLLAHVISTNVLCAGSYDLCNFCLA